MLLHSFHVRYRLCTTSAAILLLLLPVLSCRDAEPNPTVLLDAIRARLTPFHFSLATDPATPIAAAPLTLLVHVTDAASQPAAGLHVSAELSMLGSAHMVQVELDDRGAGDYAAEVRLEAPGSWNVDLTASGEGKSARHRFPLLVGE